MNRIVSTNEMRLIDNKSIGNDSSIGFNLMHQASAGLADEIIKFIKGEVRKKIAIVCGKGNNGGDGFLSAAILIRNGFSAHCFSLIDPSELKGEVLLAYKEYSQCADTEIITEGFNFKILSDYYVIVDAILGTGVNRELKSLYAKTITEINKLKNKVVAVDNPTGFNSDEGKPSKICLKADVTITLGYQKFGQLFTEFNDYIGKLKVVSLSYPLEIVRKNSRDIYHVSFNDIKEFIPKRKINGSKFDHGIVHVVSGSEGMVGASTLAMYGALRGGCGYVHGIVPSGIKRILSQKVTEPVLHFIGKEKSKYLSVKNIDSILKIIQKTNVILIGPGLSLQKETQELVKRLLTVTNRTIVLDADGINSFRGETEKIKRRKGQTILTPHKAEFERLWGELPSNEMLKVEKCIKTAKEFNVVLILKETKTIITDGETTYIVTSGNDALATAGTGDVLAGLITSFIAQGAIPLKAAVAGVYIHGLAGCLAAEEYSNYGVIASDVCENIGKAIKRVLY